MKHASECLISQKTLIFVWDKTWDKEETYTQTSHIYVHITSTDKILLPRTVKNMLHWLIGDPKLPLGVRGPTTDWRHIHGVLYLHPTVSGTRLGNPERDTVG